MSNPESLQARIREWTIEAFGTNRVLNPLMDGLSIAEETGELMRAILKRENARNGNDRHHLSVEHWSQEVQDEAADVAVALMSLAANEGFDLWEAAERRFAYVAQRYAQAMEAGPEPLDAEVCPFDCDSCHGDGCPCSRGGCDRDE